MTFSCNAPNVKDPVYSCVVNIEKGVAKCGDRNLNYKLAREEVGEWVDTPQLLSIAQAHNMVCFDLQDWLKRIKPTLKEVHDFYNDSRD